MAMKFISQFFAVAFSCVLAFFCLSCAGETSTPDNNGTPDYTIDDTIVGDDTVPGDIPHPDSEIVPELIPDVVVDDITPVDPPPEDGACVGNTGDACSTAAQCACIPSSAKQCLTTVGGYITFTGGYCSAQCTSTADCGTGANCAAITTGTNYCLKVCSSASQCRMAEGYSCTTIPGSTDTRTYCLPRMVGPDTVG
jgi:hypothetical protein